MHVDVEHFSSIADLMSELSKRPNNSIMQGEASSMQKGGKAWYGTNSYEESEDLMLHGYTEILPKVKEGIRANAKVISKQFSPTDRRRPKNLPIGFVPNVPNSILNLPNSMIDIKVTPQKRKTICITYVMAGSCGTSADMWIKAGISLLTAIKIIERRGISVKIDASFYCGSSEGQCVMGSVTVKNYGQPLDIQKLCFPLANPSMFRRIGFKFLETTPILKSRGFRYGYGRGFEADEKEIKERIETSQNYMLYGQWIAKHDYKVESILEYLNFNGKDA